MNEWKPILDLLLLPSYDKSTMPIYDKGVWKREEKAIALASPAVDLE